MNKFQTKILTLALAALAIIPRAAFALQMPQSGNELADMAGLSARSYVVADADTGEVLIDKNGDWPLTAASLTKLVTALVVLDTKPDLNKAVAIAKQDQTLGACGAGGSCIKAVVGVKFTVDGLFHAALMPSANNAASALARSTGLSMDEFAARMNEKAASLGAVNSHFNEPTGMDENNVVTARDYVHIVAAAFSNPYMQKIAGLQQYALKSANNSKYNQTIKNTDKLLADADLQMIGAKTGYLTAYNFAALLTYKGEKLAVVVLGEDHLTTAFAETKILAGLGSETRFLALAGAGPAVLGTSTQASLLHYPNL